MNRTMRLQERAIGDDEIRRILENGDWGVLSTAGRDAYPYGVPLSYVVIGDRLYIHGSNVGHKIDNIGHNPRVSFCVVGDTRVQPEMFDRDFESVVLFGRARVVTGPEKREAMEAFMNKYCGPLVGPAREHLDRHIDKIFVVRIAIERMTGKAHKAMVREGHPAEPHY